jgi:hypothetical protein
LYQSLCESILILGCRPTAPATRQCRRMTLSRKARCIAPAAQLYASGAPLRKQDQRIDDARSRER